MAKQKAKSQKGNKKGKKGILSGITQPLNGFGGSFLGATLGTVAVFGAGYYVYKRQADKESVTIVDKVVELSTDEGAVVSDAAKMSKATEIKKAFNLIDLRKIRKGIETIKKGQEPQTKEAIEAFKLLKSKGFFVS